MKNNKLCLFILILSLVCVQNASTISIHSSSFDETRMTLQIRANELFFLLYNKEAEIKNSIWNSLGGVSSLHFDRSYNGDLPDVDSTNFASLHTWIENNIAKSAHLIFEFRIQNISNLNEHTRSFLKACTILHNDSFAAQCSYS